MNATPKEPGARIAGVKAGIEGFRERRKAVKNILIVFIVLFTCSCATTANYEAKIKTWLGHDVNELISSWGPPSDVFTMPNNNKMYTWLYNGGTVVTSNYNYYLNMTFTNSTTHWCKTTFTVDSSDRIIQWRYEGNSCRSR
jgi:hypothetical protein